MRYKDLGLKDGDLESIVSILEQFGTIEEAIIFGSRAKGNYKHGSDVDIALKGNIDFKTIAQLSYLLNQESLMPYKFDTIAYARIANEALRDHIDRVGVSIYRKDIFISA